MAATAIPTVSVITSAVAAGAMIASTVHSAVAVNPAVPAAVIATAKTTVSAAEIVAAVRVTAPIKVAEALAAAKIPVIVSAEVAVIIPTELAVIVAAEVPPSIVVPPTFAAPPCVCAQIAPMVAVMVVAPPVMMEVDPRRIAKIEIGAAVERRPIEAVEPRPRADKNAVREPLRPVITVRRARVRRIRIISVCADRRRPNVCRRSHSNGHSNPYLGVRRARNGSSQDYNESNDCRIFKNSHLGASLPDLLRSLHTAAYIAMPLPNALCAGRST